MRLNVWITLRNCCWRVYSPLDGNYVIIIQCVARWKKAVFKVLTLLKIVLVTAKVCLSGIFSLFGFTMHGFTFTSPVLGFLTAIWYFWLTLTIAACSFVGHYCAF